MRKPKIAFVAEANCLRVTKEAYTLRKLGYEVHLITNQIRNYDCYNSIAFYETSFQLRQAIKVYSKYIDIFHVHNEPDYPATVVREVVPKAKIVHEMHDSNYWLLGKQTVSESEEKVKWYDEEVAVLCADAFVVPSKACKDELKSRTDKPIAWIPPACPIDWYRTKMNGYNSGLVVQGGVSIYSRGQLDHWRDYTMLLKALQGKCNIYIYSPCFDATAADPLFNHYEKLATKVGKYSYEGLLDQLGLHTWNLVGNYSPNKEIMVAKYSIHNKLFDAIAAGVPSIIFDVVECIKIVEQYGIGISVKTPDELMERWDEHIEKRKNLMLYRSKLSMENYISRLTKLYEAL